MPHKVPTVRSYLLVFASLFVLTLLTSGIAYAPIGHWHTPIGLAIAIGKALLVVCFFMHLIHSDHVSWVMLGAALFMLFVLIYLTVIDYWTRVALAG
jgi:cytochrome c oxidase subunit IV